MKLNIWKTLIISLAFFTISLAWTTYNTFVPVFIKGIIPSSAILGVIMTMDNIFGLVFQPYFGRISDRTKSKFGRRMPFIIIGIPLSALFFIMIPFYDKLAGIFNFIDLRLVFLMLFVIAMNFFMSVYRAPAIALMPDATPANLRSSANGIITAMGGMGTIIALVLGGKLFNQNSYYPFLMGGGLMVVALIVLLLFYKEPETPFTADEKEENGEDTGLFWGKNGKASAVSKTPSLLYMLFTVFFWFCGFECLNAFFTLFCTEKFGILPGDAPRLLAPMAVVFMICALPAGFISSKIGRKKAMLLGNVVIVITFILLIFIKSTVILSVILALSGIGWSFMTTNAYPAVAEMAPGGQTGRYTGYYFMFTFAASIVSPILYGSIADIMGSQTYLFFFGGVMFSLGFLFLLYVKKQDVSHNKKSSEIEYEMVEK